MNKTDFLRWFNHDFWKAFTRSTLPIKIPKTTAEKELMMESIYNDIARPCSPHS